ncbi:MAG TPA: GNAT family N-acetyltransferase [Candidatus Dormibacteraeota bacterium]|nr:GNAT family N-acetyltransferase [Candidatus Dormibacteraeota bacterium]
MTLYKIDPLKDQRWTNFLERHSGASVFHTFAWLEALHKAYGYEPIVYTTAAPGADLQNGLVFCQIDSPITGRRLVSLPFSDHCDPLVDNPADLQDLLTALRGQSAEQNWRYIEIRPLHPLNLTAALFQTTETHCFHQLDITPALDTIFRNFHKDSIQRKIRRAEREGLTEEEGRSSSLLDSFYRLQLLTRRRHRLPPQPRKWFQNLVECFGERLKIRVAFKNKQPIASILTLSYKDTLVYKYGCSDARFNNLGGMHFLFWRSIQDGKQSRLETFDLGRSESDNSGLITFKDRWGAKRSTLTYARSPAGLSQPLTLGWKLKIAKRILAHAPDSVLSMVGNLLYKHIG